MMNTQILSALLGFAFVTLFTPGPNNLMLMASGVNFGFRRTLPHMLGVAFGFPLMVAAVGAGLAQLFQVLPLLRLVLKVGAVLFMLWLAWKIAHSGAPEGAAATAGKRPLRFVDAAGFQWVNPKAWAMATVATTAYLPAPGLAGVATTAAVFLALGTCSASLWVLAGRTVARLLRADWHLRAFNIAMALLLVASLWPLLAD